MTLIEKKDLQYDYSWGEPGSNPKRPREPGSAMFDRSKGNDVLNAINRYAEENEITDKKRGLEMESRIRHDMGNDINTHKDVSEWLKSVFKDDKNK